jgi:hypothetical protein
MYHRIFRARLLQAFRDLNEGRHEKVVARYSPNLDALRLRETTGDAEATSHPIESAAQG